MKQIGPISSEEVDMWCCIFLVKNSLHILRNIYDIGGLPYMQVLMILVEDTIITT
jgi:hypothetical protein